MKEMKARKIATGMLVAVLLLSPLAIVLPAATVQAAGASGAQISLNVVDASLTPVSGATVALTETHTSTTITNTSNAAAGLVTFSPQPGYYILTITKTGYYTLQYATVVKFTGTDSVSLGPIQITALPAATGSLTVTVTPGTASVTMTTIDYNSNPKMQVTYPSFTDTTTKSLYPSTYHVVLSSPGYETEVRTVTIGASPVTLNVALNASVALSGFVYKAGSAPSGVSAVLVSTNTALPVEKRIIQPRTMSSNYFVFDAYPGSFTLLVDAADSTAYMNAMTVTTAQQLTINLNAQSGQRDTSNVAFASANWNTFDLTRVENLNFDSSWANIPYSYIPNLRMQIDFAFGNGDGTVQPSEFTAFQNRVTAFGPQNVTSDYMVRVNGTKFTNSADFTQVSFSNISGSSVTSTNGYIASFKTPYQSQSTIVNGYNAYTVLGYDKYSTANIAYRETLRWPSGYEMTSNTTQTSYAKVSGYLNVTIDTTIRGSGYYEQVTMGIQKSAAPKAVGGAQVPSIYAYAVTNKTGAVQYYIVSTNRTITYTANGSSDPNGNPLKYTWHFVGVPSGWVNTSTAWTGFNISIPSFNITVMLTVTDVAGLTASTTFYIKADGIAPVADFTVVNHTISSGTLNVNQNEALVFNGASSYDHIANSTDVGVIKTWVYTWGDGNKTTVGVGENMNVTKTYARPGTYDMSLNVTDGAGHYSIKSIVVVVKDKTSPVASFVVTKQGSTTPITTAQENTTLVFNANGTYDPYTPFSQLNFTWYFGDGSMAYGNYVTHSFQAIKTFTVYLNVTNPTENYANVSKALSITSQPRPDLRVVSIVFSPSTLTEGEGGTITVNITNVGNLVAGAPMVEFYILESSGHKTPIGNSTDLKVNGTTPVPSQLKPGEYGTISLTWTPSTKGNYTIFVNAVTAGEINRADNTDQGPVTVNEAAWKAVALYGGIFAVIIVVIVLFYMRRRLPKLPKLGKAKAEEPKKPVVKK